MFDTVFRSMSRERWQALLFCIAACSACTLVYQIDPSEQHLLPCIFHSITGLQCAGCGMTRAAHDVFHAHWGSAFMHNPFVFFILPLLCYTLLRRVALAWSLPYLPPLSSWRVLNITSAVVLLAFMIVRNIVRF